MSEEKTGEKSFKLTRSVAHNVSTSVLPKQLYLPVPRWAGYVVIFHMNVFYVQAVCKKRNDKQKEEKCKSLKCQSQKCAENCHPDDCPFC